MSNEVQQEVVKEVQNEVQNEEEPKITTAEKPKEKDPKRVAVGKRLAAISKAAKEEKMRRLMQEEESHWKRYLMVSIGLGVLSFAGYKYFFPAQKKLEPYEQKVHVEIPPAEENKKKRGKPISMFD